jgi:hypothetical protein
VGRRYIISFSMVFWAPVLRTLPSYGSRSDKIICVVADISHFPFVGDFSMCMRGGRVGLAALWHGTKFERASVMR